MAHTSTFPCGRGVRLIALVIVAISVLSPHEAQAQKQAKLTVNVSVTDDKDTLLPSGKVIIKRTGGKDKTADIANGFASVAGDYLLLPDYQVTVKADGYRQAEPPPVIPLDLMLGAANGSRELTLRRPVVMISNSGPAEPPDQGQLQKQFSDLLSKHPEVLDAVLQQVNKQPELQTHFQNRVKEGQYAWAKAIPPPTIWDYWWILGLPTAFVVGLLVRSLLYATALSVPGDESVRSPSNGLSSNSQKGHPAATPVSTNQNPDPAEIGFDTLATKVERLTQHQEAFLEVLNKLLDRQTLVMDGAAHDDGALAAGTIAQHHWEDMTPRSEQYGDFNDHAQSHYRSLVREGQISPAPTYLNAEVKSSPNDLVGDKQVFLQEVMHTQGAFVLFADDSGKGLVFPNPQLNFSQPALRAVFPQLTATDFNSSKETILPVPVTRVSDERWMVERKS